MIVPWDGLPGAEIIQKGLKDLEANLETSEAFLVAMARTKLKKMSVNVPIQAFDIEDAELKLYISLGDSQNAYREYNALRNRLGRFERALQSRISTLNFEKSSST